MIRIVGVALALLALAPTARPGDKAQAATPAEQLKALVADHEAARQAYLKATNNGDRLKTPREQVAKAGEEFERRSKQCIAGGLDLAVLVDRHLIRGLPPEWRTKPPRIGATTRSERSALGYLHGNCGQCHNARGPLASIGLDLWGDPGRPDGATLEVLASLLGRSSFRIPGQTPAHTARLSPGAPDRSAILVRMRTRDPNTQMPPLATRVVDGEAVQRVQQWIAQLSAPTAP